MKLVIVATHPIQHFCPQYRSLSGLPGVEVTVVFDSLMGVTSYHDAGFGTDVSWGSGLLEGYTHLVAAEHGGLKSILKRIDPDWTIVYGYRSPIAKATWWWALWNSRKNLAYISDSENRHRTPRRISGLIKRLVLTRLFSRVDAFLTVGDANEEYYLGHNVDPSRMTRMHFPIDPQLNFSSTEAAELRQKLALDKDDIVVLNVGKFIPRKRQSDVVAAVGQVSGAHLLMVGSGPDFDRVSAGSRGVQNVQFLGFLTPSELGSYYSLADVYVHASEFDPHPLAVSEAIAAAAVPVVADATGSWGPSDDVIPEETGFVYRTGDVAALAAILQKLVDNPAMRRDISKRAVERSKSYQARSHGGFVADLDALSKGRLR